jgi:hypothetical protein
VVTGMQPESCWTGPAWEDATLIVLARQLREAHGRVTPLPGPVRHRLHRHLLAITDLAKRDPALAARRLDVFLIDLETGADRVVWVGENR